MPQMCGEIEYLEEKFDCKIVYHIPVLWSGWELDETMYVATKDGKKILLTSNHNKWSVQDEDEITVLKVKISEYKEAIKLTQKAIHLLKK